MEKPSEKENYLFENQFPKIFFLDFFNSNSMINKSSGKEKKDRVFYNLKETL